MGDYDLGALIVMAHLARELDRLRGLRRTRDVGVEGFSVLSTWARFYNQDANRKWPPRILALVDRLVYGEHMNSTN